MMEVKLERLKRFDPKKFDQLEGLLQWCQLMGLTGKDLVSLGGHIDRLSARRQSEANLAIVKGVNIECVRGDPKPEMRFVIKTANGRYRFDLDRFGGHVFVTSYKTKARRSHMVNNYDLGRMPWRKRVMYSAVLDWHHGHLLLDF